MPTSLIRRALAVASVIALTTWGAAGTALADAGHGNSNAHRSTHTAKPGHHPTPSTGSGSTGGAHTPATKPNRASDAADNGAGNGAGHVSDNGADHGDPPGNNGTIKITPLGEQDGTPDNNPHVTCGFQIEWYGFDEGDYYSQVSFAMQAPTKDATITPHGPTSVFVGEDPASGAGTATGLDARQSYYPTFTGTPQPKQGFHVKVTVATPFAQGNDTKSKVFWVQPCATETPEGPTPPTTPTPPGGDTPGGDTPGGDTSGGSDVSPPTGDTTTVLPVRAFGTGVPTAIEAGRSGSSVLDRVRSPLPLLLMAGALAVIALGSWRRLHARR